MGSLRSVFAQIHEGLLGDPRPHDARHQLVGEPPDLFSPDGQQVVRRRHDVHGHPPFEGVAELHTLGFRPQIAGSHGVADDVPGVDHGLAHRVLPYRAELLVVRVIFEDQADHCEPRGRVVAREPVLDEHLDVLEKRDVGPFVVTVFEEDVRRRESVGQHRLFGGPAKVERRFAHVGLLGNLPERETGPAHFHVNLERGDQGALLDAGVARAADPGIDRPRVHDA